MLPTFETNMYVYKDAPPSAYYYWRDLFRRLSPMSATLPLCLLLLQTMLCTAAETKDGSILSKTDQRVHAKFSDSKAGLGITVSSSQENLLITSSTGKVLVNLMEPLYQDGKDLDQLVVIHGRPFLDHRRKNKASSYSITDEEAGQLMAAAELDQETEYYQQDELTEKLLSATINIVTDTAKNSQFHQQALRNTITDLINDPHTPVIINAAITMGEKEGITGHEYPPVLPFYAFARVLSKLYDNQDLVETSVRRSYLSTQSVCNAKLKCYSQCPPCQKHGCLGMCGNVCNCWSWVCGDCCFQRGCCIHDECCEKYGYISLACLNVLWFTCNSYSC